MHPEWHITQLQVYFQHDGAPHISVGVLEWAGPWLMDWYGGLQNLPLQSLDLIPLDFHEKHGVWMQNKQKMGTISSHFQCCKMHKS